MEIESQQTKSNSDSANQPGEESPVTLPLKQSDKVKLAKEENSGVKAFSAESIFSDDSKSALTKSSEEPKSALPKPSDEPKSALTKLSVAKAALARSGDDAKSALARSGDDAKSALAKPGGDAKLPPPKSEPNLSDSEKDSESDDSQGGASKRETASLKLTELFSETSEADEERNRARDQHRISLSKMMRGTNPPPTEEKKETAPAPTSETAPTESVAIQKTSQSPNLDWSRTEQRISRSDCRSQNFDAKPPSPLARFLSKNKLRLTSLAVPIFVIAVVVCIAHELELEKSIDLVSKEYRQKNYDQALVIIDQALVKNPNAAVANFWKGRLALKANQFDEALTYFEKACSEAPLNMDYLVYEAKAYASVHRYKDAITAYNKLLSVPVFNTGYNHTNRAFAELMTLQYNDAMDDFNRAIALEPGKRDYYANRALAYGVMGNTKKSIDEWTALIAKNPKDADAYAQRGQVESQANNLPAAEADLAKSISIKPTSVAYYTKGVIERAQKHLLPAITNFEQSLKLDPLNANALKESALVYVDLGDYKKALARLDKLATIRQTTALANYHQIKANTEMKLGRYADATADLEKILAEKPNDKAARLSHAQCAEKIGDYGESF